MPERFPPLRSGVRETDTPPPVTMTVHREPLAALLIAGGANPSDLSARCFDVLGCQLPDRPGVEGTTVEALWTGADRWMLVSPDRVSQTSLFDGRLAAEGSVLLDQSDGWLVCTIQGPAAVATLRKGLQIDIDPAAFKTGSAALTSLDHIWTCVWRPREEPDAYRLVVRRSFANAFKHWFEVSAAEFGFAISAG